MDDLRWLLLLFGLVVIALIYVYTRYQRKKAAESPQQDFFEERKEPSFKKRDKASLFDEKVTPVIDSQEPNDPELPPVQKIVTVRIVAKNEGSFPSDELVLGLRGIGMRHGAFGIFHQLDGPQEDQTVFSAASLVEPGSFDLTNLKEQKIPGISLFMVLPGPINGADAFDQMMAAARALTHSLDAELLDESGSTLSIQRERYLREEIIHHEHGANIS